MPSLLPGYEYDIFISYRQKDNKGDKWVSKFADSLKTELDATFKEDISVYFYNNPVISFASSTFFAGPDSAQLIIARPTSLRVPKYCGNRG